MKIIFDAEKALQHKKEIEEEMALENAKRKNNNRRLIAIAILFTLCIVALFVGGTAAAGPILSSLSRDIFAFILFVIVLGFGFCVVLTWWVTCENLQCHKDSDFLQYLYTPDVKYYVATQHKKILAYELANDSKSITLTLEDANHIVTTETIWVHDSAISTAVNETTVDFENNVVLIPYQEKRPRPIERK